MGEYYGAVIVIVLLILFFLSLPDLDRKGFSSLMIPCRESRCLTKTDLLIMAVLTAVSGVLDFSSLGDTSAPVTFADMSTTPAYITIDRNKSVSRIMLYTGVGIGAFDISVPDADGRFIPAGRLEQTASEVLKWNCVVPVSENGFNVIRITSEGNVYLGEVVLYDENSELIPFSCTVPELGDEQSCAQSTQNFMNSSYFDEIYHARTAWEHLNGVYPYEISHPPLGKLIIAIGISLFGMTPFGWRFSGTLFGVLMVPIIYIFSKRLFGGRRIPFCCAVLLVSGFMHFVQTRIATIDTYAVFFILLMYLFMYEYIESRSLVHLALCGLSFGLGAASKWTCFYAGAGLAVIWAADRVSHRPEGFSAFVKNALFCIVFFVLLPGVIYYLAYIPYGKAMNVSSVFSREYLDIVLENQRFMFTYHSGLVAEHPYSSVWYQWLLDIRPILYYLEYFPDGSRSSFGAFVNPLVCWGGLISLFVVLFCAITKKDRRAWFLLCAYFAQLVPWMFVTRLTFEYHYFPCTVFLVLSLGYVFSLMERGTRRWKAFVYSFAGASCALFVLFYPVLSGCRISGRLTSGFLQWLPTWPF